MKEKSRKKQIFCGVISLALIGMQTAAFGAGIGSASSASATPDIQLAPSSVNVAVPSEATTPENNSKTVIPAKSTTKLVGDSGATVYTNAVLPTVSSTSGLQNFGGSFNVNPQNGQVSANENIATLQSDNGLGPTVPLSMTYSAGGDPYLTYEGYGWGIPGAYNYNSFAISDVYPSYSWKLNIPYIKQEYGPSVESGQEEYVQLNWNGQVYNIEIPVYKNEAVVNLTPIYCKQSGTKFKIQALFSPNNSYSTDVYMYDIRVISDDGTQYDFNTPDYSNTGLPQEENDAIQFGVGNLSSITNSKGYSVQFHYTPQVPIVSGGYNGLNELTSITDNNGTLATFTPSGETVTTGADYKFTPFTQVVIKTLSPDAKSSADFSGSSVTTTLNYNQTTDLTEPTDVKGVANELTSITNPEGETTSFTYALQTGTQIEPDGDYAIQNAYTQGWAMTGITTPTGATVNFGYTYEAGPWYTQDTTNYQLYQQVLMCTSVSLEEHLPNGWNQNLQTTTYDYNNGLPSDFAYNFDNSQTADYGNPVTPPSGSSLTSQGMVEYGQYDEWMSNIGHLSLASQLGYFTNETDTINGTSQTTKYHYDAEGNLRQTSVYSSANKLLVQSSSTYDDQGYSSFAALPNDYNMPQSQTATVYEESGGLAVGSNSSTVSETTHYDGSDNPTEVDSPDGTKNISTYYPASGSATGMEELVQSQTLYPASGCSTTDNTSEVATETWNQQTVNGIKSDNMATITHAVNVGISSSAPLTKTISTMNLGYDNTSGDSFIGLQNSINTTQGSGVSWKGDISSVSTLNTYTLTDPSYPGYLVESGSSSGTATIGSKSYTGDKTVLSYNGLPLYTVDTLGNVVSYQYDSLGRNISTTTTPVGGTPITSTFTYTDYYSSSGAPQSPLQLTGLSNVGSGDWAYSQVQSTDPTGYQMETYFDQMGRIIAIYDKLPKETNWTLQKSYGYNDMMGVADNTQLANVTTYTPSTVKGVTTTYAGETTYAYDDMGRSIAEEDAQGQISGCVYADASNMFIRYSLDSKGNLYGPITVSQATNYGRVTDSYSFSPSEIGSKVQGDITSGYTTDSALNGGGVGTTLYSDLASANFFSDMLAQVQSLIGTSTFLTHSHTGYDGYGNAISSSFSYYNVSNKLVTLTSTNSLSLDGTLSTTTDAQGNKKSDYYNMLGGLNSELIVPATPGEAAYTSASMQYDGLGEVVSGSDTLGNTDTYSYNADGSLKSTTDALGNTLDYSYYPDGMPENVYNASNPEDVYSKIAYNSLEQVSEVDSFTYPVNSHLNMLGHTYTTYGYNADGSIASETFKNYSGLYTNEVQTLGFSYDTAGRVTQSTDSLGETFNDVYTNGELAEEWTGNGSKDGLEDNTYGYDAAGNVSTVAGANGNSSTMTYNSLGELNYKAYEVGAAGVTNQWAQDSDTYTYDNLGRIQTDTRNETNSDNGAPVDMESTYTYNDINGDLMSDALSSYNLYPEYNGKEVYNINYTYDSLGNLQTKTELGKPSGLFRDQPTLESVAYAYNKAKYPMQLTSLSINGVSGSAITYNNEQQMITDYNGNTFYYDPTGKMVQTKTANGTMVDYSYDGSGSTASTINDSSETTTALYMGGNIISGSSELTYLPDGYTTEAVGSAPSTANQVFENSDINGNVIDSIPKSTLVGSTVAQQMRVYDPYGAETTFNVSNPTLSNLEVPGMLGETQDSATGYTYLGDGFRAYDSNTGRFLNEDPNSPLGAGGINGFAYCGGDPINNSDPTGASFLSFLGDAISDTCDAIQLTQDAVSGNVYGASQQSANGDYNNNNFLNQSSNTQSNELCTTATDAGDLYLAVGVYPVGAPECAAEVVAEDRTPPSDNNNWMTSNNPDRSDGIEMQPMGNSASQPSAASAASPAPASSAPAAQSDPFDNQALRDSEDQARLAMEHYGTLSDGTKRVVGPGGKAAIGALGGAKMGVADSSGCCGCFGRSSAVEEVDEAVAPRGPLPVENEYSKISMSPDSWMSGISRSEQVDLLSRTYTDTGMDPVEAGDIREAGDENQWRTRARSGFKEDKSIKGLSESGAIRRYFGGSERTGDVASLRAEVPEFSEYEFDEGEEEADAIMQQNTQFNRTAFKPQP